MKVIFALVLVCGMYFAMAEHTPCDVADQFQAQISQIFVKGDEITLEQNGQLYFDYPNKRIRVDVSGEIQNTKEQAFVVSVFEDFKTNTTYTLNRQTNTCKKMNGVYSKLISTQIPSSAVFVGTKSIGDGYANTWFVQDKPDQADWIITVSAINCFIVSYAEINSTTGGIAFAQQFANFIPSLPPYIFDIPAVCT
eukprot:TRINITY_DN1568_c0_g4_i2.p1 TRINITY_DN1568_c0_g4~~TRINITY_DN1568_c0_g4_i2.p1  ORF type:complete len:195 (-),score=33.91 TRINITY_DN1568_c0_g4_i2:66-650(-)